MRNKKPAKQAAIPTKNESNKGDSKGIKSLSMKLYLQLKPLWTNYTEYKEYLELNYNAITGSIENKQIELYRNKVLRQWKRSQTTIETLHSVIDKKEKTIFRDILSEYYQLFKKQSLFPEIKNKFAWYVREGQKKKRIRISKEEKAFLEIKDQINSKSFGRFVNSLSQKKLDYSNSTYSRLWNKYYKK